VTDAVGGPVVAAGLLQESLTFTTIGVLQGALYGLLAVGLVLVYKGARVFNFAQGEFGTVAAFIMFVLLEQAGLPFAAALLGGLAAAVLVGLLVERLVIRPLFNASRVTVLVALVGVALFIIAVTFVVGKPEPRVLRSIVDLDPASSDFVLLGANIEMQQVLVVLVLGALAAVLAYLFKRTNTGLAVLALSQDPTATRIMGISIPAMSRLIWGFAALLGGIAGILQAGIPGQVFTPGFMTATSLIPAFAGAVLGGMTSLPGAFAGGILIGVAQNLGIALLQRVEVPGASELTVFAVLLIVLLVRPRGLLGTEA
jgi:branched-chain amino acid transport system permease protein